MDHLDKLLKKLEDQLEIKQQEFDLLPKNLKDDSKIQVIQEKI